MNESARPRRDARRESIRDLLEALSILVGNRDVAGEDSPLHEMLDLPP
jgi:hypothetical protein